MATRSGGRNDDRSSQRNVGGSGGTGRGTASSGASSARGGTSARGASNATNASTGASRSGGTTANRDQSATSPQSGASKQNASTAGTTPTSGATAQSSTPRNQTESTSQSTSSGNEGASARTDRERELRTSREQGRATRGAAPQQRGNVNAQAGGYGAPTFGWGNSPFAMMRRMMDDMDRLFSDFGFMHPGQLASSLFGSDPFPSATPQRTLGGGAAPDTRLAPQQGRGQQELQRGRQGGALSSLQGLWSPQVEVFERGNNLVVRADLPGLSRQDVDVELDEDALIIRGHRHNELESENEGYYRSERSYGSFYRAIPLPEGVDASACNATFKDGVLEVTLPKPERPQSRTRRIDVR